MGGGPVGLATAIELGIRGLDCVVIEQGDGQVGNAKFVDINMRTMEFCRRWGVAEEIRDRGFNPDYAQDLIYVTTLTGLSARPPAVSVLCAVSHAADHARAHRALSADDLRSDPAPNGRGVADRAFPLSHAVRGRQRRTPTA